MDTLDNTQCWYIYVWLKLIRVLVGSIPTVSTQWEYPIETGHLVLFNFEIKRDLLWMKIS